MGKISVVILTARRRDELLARGLAALAAGALRPDEVILVETVPTDVALVVPQLPIRRVPSHDGSFAEARNAGVREAAGECIAFMDDDCEPDNEWLSRLHDAIVVNGWSAAGGNVFPAHDVDPPPAFSPELSWAVGCNPPGFFSALAGRLYLPNTSSLMATKELLKRIPFQAVEVLADGSEEGSWSYETGREDAQWWRSVRLAGERCGVAPRAIVWHHIGAERFELDVLRERIANDGRAHWHRTRNKTEVQPAARDVVNAPFAALVEMFSTQRPNAQVWEEHLGWASRQAAFLDAAVKDFNHGITPVERARAYGLECVRLVTSGMKASARHVTRIAFPAFRRLAQVPTVEAPPRRMLVVLHDFLGDAVLAVPMLGQLARALPETRITILTGDVCAPLLRENAPRGARIVQPPRNARGRSPHSSIHLYRFLEGFHPDVVLIGYCHGLSPAPFFFLGHAPVISWREDNGFRQRIWGDLVSVPVRKDFRKAESVALLDLLAPLGIAARVERKALRFSEAAKERTDSIVAKANAVEGGYVVVHFEPGNRWKFWPPERLAEVVRNLLAENLPVILVGSRAGRIEAERQGLMGLANCHSLHNGLSSDELAALMAGAALFVGCDSGPAHVAQGVGTASVVLFGATERHRWGPEGNGIQNLTGKAVIVSAGQGDWLVEESLGLPVNGAMRLLSVGAVMDAVREALERARPERLAGKS
ncbi:glycosyltransferase [Candidatus Sumerlaeota bacterium]|nr:glycosyltransferase [Candidatus Sumerlaeota bacterium]